GIFSTDIRDLIFLVREIRRHASNVVLFTIGADLIYLHSDVNLDFRGMLLVTTYPLFSRNQLWTNRDLGRKIRLQFPNDTAQGVYNAMLALLGTKETQKRMLEYGRPFDCGQNLQEPRLPPLWLTAVGKNDLWPVRLLENRLKNRSGKENPGKCSDVESKAESYLYAGVAPELTPSGSFEQRKGFYSRGLIFILLSLILLFAIPYSVLLMEFWPKLSSPRSRSRVKPTRSS